jgi:N-acetyl-gamma-glutamyl-phosphate reductase
MIKGKIKAGIIGGSGFTGLELIKILEMHNSVKISFITSRTFKGKAVSDVFPAFKEYKNEKLVYIEKPGEKNLKGIDIIFLCLPPLESMKFLKDIWDCYDFKVIDIGSDFRIKDPDSFKKWYGSEHISKNKLPDFVYGLTELYKEKIKNSSCVANPGCYPVSILLALAPVLESNMPVKDIYIDSKSGVSGAGRKLADEYLFSNLNNNFYAYSTVGHRHIGEIEQEIKNIGGKEIKISFTPHLMALSRGIFTTIYCKLNGIIKDGGAEEKIFNMFQNFCKEKPFVKFLGNKIPQIKDVAGTNMCMIGIDLDHRTGTLKIFSAIDNLLKGAAGQAVQNMNIMMGFDETEGLEINGFF